MLGKIIDKKEIVIGTLLVTFQLNQKVDFKPGQYIIVTMLRQNLPDRRGQQRIFSIVNDPSDNKIIQIATRITESSFKKTLQELPVGTEVELGPIAGVFTLPDDISKPLVLIAGGIGITPFMSMLRHIKKNNLDYQVTLLYSNRNQQSAAFLEELRTLEKGIANFGLIFTMTEDPAWSGESRKIDAQFIKEYFPNANSNSYFVVGPPPMVDAIRKSLNDAGVAEANIKFENFTGY